MSLYQSLAHLYKPTERATLIRQTGTARWKSDYGDGHWHYNTHHLVYQFGLPEKRSPLVLPVEAIECTDAEFEQWVEWVRSARRMVAETLGDVE